MYVQNIDSDVLANMRMLSYYSGLMADGEFSTTGTTTAVEQQVFLK